MNTTQEIPRAEWMDFFDDLSRRLRGSLVSIEVLDSETGVGEEARNMVLEGALAELRHGAENVTVLVGESPEDHLSHTIEHPVHVRLRRTESGELRTLQIQSPASTTLVHFRFTTQPEALHEEAAREALH